MRQYGLDFKHHFYNNSGESWCFTAFLGSIFKPVEFWGAWYLLKDSEWDHFEIFFPIFRQQVFWETQLFSKDQRNFRRMKIGLNLSRSPWATQPLRRSSQEIISENNSDSILWRKYQRHKFSFFQKLDSFDSGWWLRRSSTSLKLKDSAITN